MSSDFEQDELVLAELKSQNIGGLTVRGKSAIKELAEMGDGASIFLFLTMNSRIRKLEEQVENLTKNRNVA